MSTSVNSGPAVAVIDQNNVLAINWQPAAVDGGYAAYQGWNIYLSALPLGSPQLQTNPNPGTIYSFTEQLTPGEWGIGVTPVLTAEAISAGYVGTAWDFNRPFPTTIAANEVTLSSTVTQLNQPVTVTLDASYSGADSWRVVFADGSDSGWQPISLRTIVKAFSAAGNQPLVIQVQNSFSLGSPAVQLIRTLSTSLYVMNQEYNPAGVQAQSLTGTLGLGGASGFELISNASEANQTPYLTVIRSLVRDTVTNELKLLVATSRFTQASSLLGTMALDVFPITGRPKTLDAVQIPPELTADGQSTALANIVSTVLPTLTVGKPMSAFQLQAEGGSFPYSWYATNLPDGLNISVDGTLSGTPVVMGLFTISVSLVDASSFIVTKQFQINITSDLAVVSSTLAAAVVGVPYSTPLVASGGAPPYSWALVSGSLVEGLKVTDTGQVIGVPVSYNSTTDFSTPLTGTVQVTDAIGAKASAVVSISLSAAPLNVGQPMQQTVFVGEKFNMTCAVYGGVSPYTLQTYSDAGIISTPTLIDGLISFSVNPTAAAVGTQTVNFTIKDSANTSVTKSVTYHVLAGDSAGDVLSDLQIDGATFDHLWFDGDATAVSLNVIGPTSGLYLNPVSVVAANGITAQVGSSSVVVSGPPSVGHEGNSQISIPLELMYAGAQVAKLSREYTVVSQSSGAARPWAGTTTYVLGQEVVDSARNVQVVTTAGISGASQPTWNAVEGLTTADNTVVWTNKGLLNIGAMTSTAKPYMVGEFVGISPLKTWFNQPSFTFPSIDTVRVNKDSALPPGLSLDANTGLMYGVLADTFPQGSIIEYVDGGVVVGTVTVNWSIVESSFLISDSLPVAEMQVPYSGTVTSTVPLSSFSIFSGRLPDGITYTVSGSTVTFSGTPTESGYFDVWFSGVGSSNGIGYLYKRFAVRYVLPPVILTQALPTLSTGVAYSTTLKVIGGVPPYTWALESGTLPTGVTFTNGVIAGTTTDANGTTYNLGISVTDSRGVKATTTLSTSVSNPLSVSTTTLPIGIQGVPLSFQIQATGGVPPYSTWVQTNTGALNLASIGLSLSSSGLLSGTPSPSSFSGTLQVQVTDSVSNTASASLPLTIAASASSLGIDSSKVTPVLRGVTYHGLLSVSGTGVSPYTWAISPASANQLPSGLSLAGNVGDNGATANIYGTTTLAPSTTTVLVLLTDNNGNYTTKSVDIVIDNGLEITTPSLPLAIVTSPYSSTLKAINGIGTLTWSIQSGTLPSGLSLNSATGEIYGTPTVAASANMTFKVTDSAAAPADTATTNLILTSQNSTLAITTASLPNATAGVAYMQTLGASGGTSPYGWTLDPSSAALPDGLTLSSSGVISGTTSKVGTFSLVFRVTDAASAYVSSAIPLTVVSGFSVVSGVDYTNSISTGSLGYIASGNVNSINPRSNFSFYVVASGLKATATNQIKVTTNLSSITGTVINISSGVATISLSGTFNNGSSGQPTSVVVSVTDVTGVTVSQTFTWSIFNSKPLALTPISGTFPTHTV